MILPLTLIRCGGLPFERLIVLGKDWDANFEMESTLKIQCELSKKELIFGLSQKMKSLDLGEDRTALYKILQLLAQGKIINVDNPYLSRITDENIKYDFIKLIDSYKSKVYQIKEHQKLITEHWKIQLNSNISEIRETAQDEQLKRGLLFSSHDLLQRIPIFLSRRDEMINKKDRQIALSLYQYIARASAKTSPFSRFTTVSYKRINEISSIPEGFFENKEVVTPNVALLEALYEMLLNYPVFYKSLSLKINPSLEKEGDYYKFLYFDGKVEGFQSLESDETIDFVVSSLQAVGLVNFQKFHALCRKEIDAESQPMEHFIVELTEIGLIEWVFPEKGLSNNWCSALLNFMAFLPDEPVVLATTELLYWLKNSAHAIPWLSIDEVRKNQVDTIEKLKIYFNTFEGTMPPIKPEQVFYEDVIAEDLESDIQNQEFRNKMTEFIDILNSNSVTYSLTREQFRMSQYFKNSIEINQSNADKNTDISFINFARDYLSWEHTAQSKSIEFEHRSTATFALKPVQMGLLAQFFRDENGNIQAVVNALYTGGGKMFARWLPFSSHLETLQNWSKINKNTYSFDHYGYFNANMHPIPVLHSIATPGGKNRQIPSQSLNLNEIFVRMNETTHQLNLVLNDGTPIFFNDWGLESIETRPAAIQLLWKMGISNISIAAQFGDDEWHKQEVGYDLRERFVIGQWTIRRKAWKFEKIYWQKKIISTATEAEFFLQLNRFRRDLSLPRYVFYAFQHLKKPQYLDYYSPISVLLFEKMLRNNPDYLIIEEMLPSPNQLLVNKQGRRVAEFTTEFCI